MDSEKQRNIASKGGRNVPDEKRSFSPDRELAAEAGRKGGASSHASQQSHANQQSASASDRRQQGDDGYRGGSGNVANNHEPASGEGARAASIELAGGRRRHSHGKDGIRS
jgi:general stress protein YciG